MVIRDELRKILNIIADKTESNPSSSVIDSAVIRERVDFQSQKHGNILTKPYLSVKEM
ncbi:MAG: hypothetical protein WBL44_09020 [Nitrososphaeraceae archaeon]|jgi:hypothetical protein